MLSIPKLFASRKGNHAFYREMSSGRPFRLGSFLSKYGVDVTLQAKDGKIDPVVGRDEVSKSVLCQWHNH